MREDTRSLDEIVAAVAEAGGSITEGAVILEISKQAVSKRLRGVRVLHELWSRKNGDGSAAKAILKAYSEDFEEKVVKTISREARRWGKAWDRVDRFEKRQEDLRADLEETEDAEKSLKQEATESGDVEGVSKQIAEIRAKRDTLRDVISNLSVAIGEAKVERDDAAKKLEAAVRRAVLAFREDVTKDLVERLEGIRAMDKAFEKAVIDGLNGMREQGLPVSPGVMGITETSIISGDEVDTAIRDLRRRLDAPADMERRKEQWRKERERFEGKKVGEPVVTGELVQKP